MNQAVISFLVNQMLQRVQLVTLSNTYLKPQCLPMTMVAMFRRGGDIIHNGRRNETT